MNENITITHGTYGSAYTPCRIFIYENGDGSRWYAVEDSVNVNLTYDDIYAGCDVESLTDVDTFTSSEPIDAETRMTRHCEGFNEYLEEQSS